MARKTFMVEPHELCQFVEEKYNISNDLASRMIWWVTPECEVRTRKYVLNDIRQEMIDEPEEESAYPEYPVSPNQMLIDYMVDNSIAEFTLTQ